MSESKQDQPTGRYPYVDQAWAALLAGDVERATEEVRNANDGYRIIGVFAAELRARFSDRVVEWLNTPQLALDGETPRESIDLSFPSTIREVMRLLWPDKFDRPRLRLYARDYRPVEELTGFLETRDPEGCRINPLDLHDNKLPPAIERAAWREAVPLGWLALYDQLMIDLENVAPGFRLSQVKEKLGGLRVYCRSVPKVGDKVADLRLSAEDASYRTCAACGAPGRLHVEQGSGFLITLCAEHADGFDPYIVSR